jgi:phage shock protein C
VNTQKRLYRSTDDRMFAGVCGGIAQYLEVDPTLVRLVFVALTLLGGPGIIIYIVLMLIVPEYPQKAKKVKHEELSGSVVKSSIPVPEPEEAEPNSQS